MRLMALLLLAFCLAAPAQAARDARVGKMIDARDEALKFKREGNLPKAQEAIERAIAIGRTIPQRTPLAEPMLREDLAMIYLDQGRYDAAETELRASLAARAQYGKPNDPSLNVPLNALATSLLRQGKSAEAAPIFEQLVDMDAKAQGPQSVQVAYSLNNLAGAYMASAQLDKAEAALLRAYDLGAKAGKKGQEAVANSATNLAGLYKHLQRYNDAEKFYRISMDTWGRLRPKDSPEVLLATNNLGVYYRDRGRYDQAQPLLDFVFDTRLGRLGQDNPDVALSANNLGWLHAGKQEWAYAAQLFTASMGTYTELRRRQAAAALAGKGTTGVSLHELSRPVSGLVGTAYRFAVDAPADKQAAVRDTAFMAAQWLSQGEAATALARTSARFSAGSGQLASLVREQQDLASEWGKLDGAVTAALADPRARNSVQMKAARDRLAAIDTRLGEIAGQIAGRFPDYATLADPQPVDLVDIQKVLQPDEALIAYAFFPESTLGKSWIWVVTKNDAIWAALQIAPEDIAFTVAKLRCGLDYGAIEAEATAKFCAGFGADADQQRLAPFDAMLSYQLWQSILGPAAAQLKGKKLLLVTPEPLAALPFQVLVTEEPKVAKPESGADLKATAFLGRSNAITVLPSIAALRTMRTNAKASAAPDAYLGFGDPVLTGTRSCPRIPAPDACPTIASSAGITRQARAARAAGGMTQVAMADGIGLADADAVRLLCPLADTATEIKCVGASLGAAPATMHIGPDASEAELKKLPLERYRVLHFATHGLLAGDTSQMSAGLAEPALVLTPPARASALDDGLLTASEIAALKLDADWVILSACNTAAGNGHGETLSGLARAFLYAGSRALLVSHWPVTSSAAVELTTGAFDAIKADPTLGRAEAMRRSMSALIDTGDDFMAHPSYWAPFSVVGEGDAPAP
ncbi:CHAT domain-containing protein [Starkeya sp. ORNL1]|nr:CHAT domain-containing protein [Starkeya sp. ORNL1]